MKTASKLPLFLILFLFAVEAPAQTPRRKSANRPTAKPTPTQAVAQPTSTPTSAPAQLAPVLLATVNGQNVTTADIDPTVRAEVEGVPAKIAEARKRILELEINTLLLENEARKRKVTTQQLYDAEVTKKIPEPAAAEVNKFIADNQDQIDGSDPAALRQQVADFLRGEREARLSDEFVKRLRATTPVVMGAEVDANTPTSVVLATVGGRPILAGRVNERLKPIIYKLRFNAYLSQKPALDVTVSDLLLLAEASRQNVAPEEIVRKEISEKIRPATDAEIEKFYSENKGRLKGDLNSMRSVIANYLQDQERERLELALADRLRKGADIRLLISEPEPPVQTISSDDDPVQGDANAPVTIVEFTDFQCPSCAAMHPVIDEVLKTYGNKVRFVVRDFPLAMHANARKAAEAANAAHAQSKFFEYAALLFKRQNALDVPSLKKYATELGLNRAVFDAALDGGKYSAEVKHDIADGEMYGVDSTPTIFVNGVLLKTLSAEGLRTAIDRSLASTTSPKASSP